MFSFLASFHILYLHYNCAFVCCRAHFNYDQPNKGEMSFRKGDVFHVVDTLHNGVVGSWQVFRIGTLNSYSYARFVLNKFISCFYSMVDSFNFACVTQAATTQRFKKELYPTKQEQKNWQQHSSMLVKKNNQLLKAVAASLEEEETVTVDQNL